MLDNIATEQRLKLENKIEEQDEIIQSQKSRMVPKKKHKSYKYMIWKEEENDNIITLHLVRRNNRSFSALSSIRDNPSKCWFLREDLPVAMTPNEDVKRIVRNILPGNEYRIGSCKIKLNKKYLSILHKEITKYFNEFQIS